jgi:predicted HNH restriction endonuclease
MEKKKKYNEAKQTLQALKNLGAEVEFVSFEKIFNEFMNIRGSKVESLTKKSLNNLYGRVRRSLVLNKETLELKERIKTIKEGDQSRELSISLKFPEYLVKSKHPITIIENGGEKDGDIKYTPEVEENEFKLIKVKNENDSLLKSENETLYEVGVVIGENQELLSEGKVKSVVVNSYERNPKARKICIKHFGVKCQVCSFDFEKKYGEIGKDFIHVHHKIDISIVGKEYEINPIQDLIPVCPNCHSMLHKKKPAYSIEELKQIMFK